MNDPIISERALRDAAKAALTGRYQHLRQSLAERGIGARLADDAKGKAKAVAKEAGEIAADNKGVIAATVGALALWAFRKPLLEQAEKWLPQLSSKVTGLAASIRERFRTEPEDNQETGA